MLVDQRYCSYSSRIMSSFFDTLPSSTPVPDALALADAIWNHYHADQDTPLSIDDVTRLCRDLFAFIKCKIDPSSHAAVGVECAIQNLSTFVKRLMERLDINQDGKVTYVEFTYCFTFGEAFMDLTKQFEPGSSMVALTGFPGFPLFLSKDEAHATVVATHDLIKARLGLVLTPSEPPAWPPADTNLDEIILNYKLSPEHFEQIRLMFCRFADSSTRMTKNGFRKLLGPLGVCFPVMANSLFDSLKQSNSESLSFGECMQFLGHLQVETGENTMPLPFGMFDIDNDGRISRMDLQTCIRERYKSISRALVFMFEMQCGPRGGRSMTQGHAGTYCLDSGDVGPWRAHSVYGSMNGDLVTKEMDHVFDMYSKEAPGFINEAEFNLLRAAEPSLQSFSTYTKSACDLTILQGAFLAIVAPGSVTPSRSRSGTTTDAPQPTPAADATTAPVVEN